LRARPDFGADLRQAFAEAHPLQLAQTVRVDENAGTDFA
jgi:hypothetical protein